MDGCYKVYITARLKSYIQTMASCSTLFSKDDVYDECGFNFTENTGNFDNMSSQFVQQKKNTQDTLESFLRSILASAI